MLNESKEKDKTHSTSENRNPIQARGPPINDKMFDQTPGTEVAAFGIFVQRSGLEKKKKTTIGKKEYKKTEPT